MIALTFALSQESRDLVELLEAPKRMGSPALAITEGHLAGQGVVILHTGVGAEMAAKRAAAFMERVRPRLVIGAGFAGGLDPSLRLGDLIIGTNVSAPDQVERCRALVQPTERVHFGPIVGAHVPIETVAEKAEFARISRGLAVDMESAALTAACASVGVPFLSVRAISDSADAALPVPFGVWFDLERQKPRPSALVRYLIAHPQQFWPFVRFVRGLTPARRTLTAFLVRLIETETA